MNSYWVYMLRCDDDSYYIGITNDITHRVDEHNMSKDKHAYTFKRRPVVLVYSAEFNDVHEAIHWEKVLKRWSRKKKEAVINNEWEKLPILARTAMNWLIYPYIKQNRFHVILSLSKHRHESPCITRVDPSTGSG